MSFDKWKSTSACNSWDDFLYHRWPSNREWAQYMSVQYSWTMAWTESSEPPLQWIICLGKWVAGYSLSCLSPRVEFWLTFRYCKPTVSSISLKAASQSATVLKSTPTHDDAADNTSLELTPEGQHYKRPSPQDKSIFKCARLITSTLRFQEILAKSSELQDLIRLGAKSSWVCSDSFSSCLVLWLLSGINMSTEAILFVILTSDCLIHEDHFYWGLHLPLLE